MKKIFGLSIYLRTLALLIIFSFWFFLTPNSTFAFPQNFYKQTIVEGLNEPTDFAISSDNRIFIAEKSGKIKLIKDGNVLSDLVATFPANIRGERGLLGIVLDPDFPTNNFIYILYINNDPLEYHISRFTLNADKMLPGSEVVLYKTTTNINGTTHIGGGLKIGPDGKLWFTIGDNTLDSVQEPQKLTSPYGKLHRINIDGTIPEDNPFVGQNGVIESIWSYGLRNPFRFSFLADGRPIIGDVGGDFWEEVNLGVKGGNFGWPICEGSCQTAGMINPTYQYAHNNQNASITGGLIYNGSMFPEEYKNSYIFGDYSLGFIKRLTFNNQGGVDKVEDIDSHVGAVVGFQQGTDGALYYLNIYPVGGIYKIVYSTANQPPSAKISATPTYGDSPLTVKFSSDGSTDPENDALTYKWNFGDGTTSNEQNPSHIYQNKGNFTASLVINDGHQDSANVTTTVSVGNLPPEVNFISPQDNKKYNAGDIISYEATATDREDGQLGADKFSWTVVFHHEDHIHPYSGPINNVKSGTFKIENKVERSPDTWYEIILTVTDSNGLKTVVHRSIYPNKVTITIGADPSNMVVKLNGIPYATPYTTEAVVGFNLTLEAETPLDRDGKTFTFKNWSDSANNNHVVVIPNVDTTYSALYETNNTPSQTKANTIITGDVKVDGVPLYDDDSKTGLVVLLEQDATVEAPWGATYNSNPDRSTADQNLTGIVDQVKTKGCGGGCTDVKVIKWPTDKPVEKIYQISAGQKLTVDQNSVVVGDIKINGEAQYDDLAESGLVTLMEQNAEVEAPWGALVFRNSSKVEAESTLQNEAANLKDEGCGGNCTVITILHWPSEKPSNKILELNPGEKVKLPKYTVISGDIKVNSDALYDDIETTGLVTELEEEGEVEAPWGATYSLNPDQMSADIAIDQLVMRVKNNGCINGCSNVTMLHWPNQLKQGATATLYQLMKFVDNWV